MKTQQYFLTAMGGLVLALALLSSPPSVSAAPEIPLLSEQAVEPFGLTRAWFNQIRINPKRSKVLQAVVEGGTMFVVSDDAKLHVLDAETGKTLWTRTLGDRVMTFEEPAVNSRMVAVVNEVELFVFNRNNGKMLLQIPLPGATSTGCELSENYVYVPMVDDRILAFPLIDDKIRMEEEGAGVIAAAAAAATDDEAAAADDEIPESSFLDDGDPVLRQIQKSFSATKKALYAEAAPPKKEPEVFLRTSLGIPMVSQSFGDVLIRPLITSQTLLFNERKRVRLHRETLLWATEGGQVLAGSIHDLSQDLFELRFMVNSSARSFYMTEARISETEWSQEKAIMARPTVNQCVPFLYESEQEGEAEIPNIVLVGTKDAYLFAIRDRVGDVVWRFVTKGPVQQRVAVIGTDVYCPCEAGLHAVDLLTGVEKWFTPGVNRFVAASKERLYGTDARGRMVIMDRETGMPLTSFDARRFNKILFNIETDRIYLITDAGLIQCLHERQLTGLDDLLSEHQTPPLRHRISCKQFAGILTGKPAPSLYWVASDEEGDGFDEEPLGGTDDDPFAAPARTRDKADGEDESLDGNDWDEEETETPAGDEEEDEDWDEENPFG